MVTLTRAADEVYIVGAEKKRASRSFGSNWYNCLVQAKAAGLVEDRWAMRRIIAEAFPPQVFNPQK